jgi:hypothetical protein
MPDFVFIVDRSGVAEAANLEAVEVPEDTYPVMRGWAPRYLVEWLFDQDRIWITAKGEQKFISQMEADHLLNTLLFLERNEDDLNEGGVPTGTLQHTALYQAIKRRLLETLYGAR